MVLLFNFNATHNVKLNGSMDGWMDLVLNPGWMNVQQYKLQGIKLTLNVPFVVAHAQIFILNFPVYRVISISFFSVIK